MHPTVEHIARGTCPTLDNIHHVQNPQFRHSFRRRANAREVSVVLLLRGNLALVRDSIVCYAKCDKILRRLINKSSQTIYYQVTYNQYQFVCLLYLSGFRVSIPIVSLETGENLLLFTKAQRGTFLSFIVSFAAVIRVVT